MHRLFPDTLNQLISDLHSLLLHGKHSIEAEQSVLLHCHLHDPSQSAVLRRVHHRRHHQDENLHEETSGLFRPPSDLPEGESALGVYCEIICLFIKNLFIFYLLFIIVALFLIAQSRALTRTAFVRKALDRLMSVSEDIILLLSESQLEKALLLFILIKRCP